MKSYLLSAALGAAFLASAIGSASAETTFGPAGAQEIYYWVSQNSTLPLFVNSDYRGLERAAKDLNVQVRIAGPTTIDLPALIAALDQVCAQRPAGVSVVGWDPSLSASVDQCIELGVPVVADDGDLPNSKRLTFIGTDWTNIGIAQAKAMVEALPDGGKIATLSIPAGYIMQLAIHGFADYLAQFGDKYEIVANEDDMGSAQTAAQVTAALLAAHPDLKGIAGFDSESGAGIVTALNEAGLAGKIAVTAMEQTPEFMKTIKDGSVAAIIVQNRELFTYYAMRTLHDFNHNGLTTNGLTGWDGIPVPVNIDTGVLVVTKDNVDLLLEAMASKN